MDGLDLDRVRDDLVAWGLVEHTGSGLAWSRRFRGAVMRVAAGLAQVEKAGTKPPGAPLENAVRGALEVLAPAGAGEVTATHERFLVAVEVAALPPGLAAVLGAGAATE